MGKSIILRKVLNVFTVAIIYSHTYCLVVCKGIIPIMSFIPMMMKMALSISKVKIKTCSTAAFVNA